MKVMCSNTGENLFAIEFIFECCELRVLSLIENQFVRRGARILRERRAFVLWKFHGLLSHEIASLESKLLCKSFSRMPCQSRTQGHNFCVLVWPEMTLWKWKTLRRMRSYVRLNCALCSLAILSKFNSIQTQSQRLYTRRILLLSLCTGMYKSYTVQYVS